MSVSPLLNGEASPCGDLAEPVLFHLTRESDRAALSTLLERDPPRFVHDSLLAQLAELVELREPTRKLTPDEVSARVQAHLAGKDPESYGTWVHFPWSARLVHVLPRDEYREVRSARNRYKITRAEQDRLAEARIGVVGLSVGNMAAVTFALEGVGTSFRIADFDDLSLSNLNRLRGGVADLGVNKTVLAAREMYELDPYLEIERFARGVDAGNMDDFLLGGGRLDLVVEECDDLYVKVAIRERCRELGIPVIMDTSDRGLLDVERFDLEPDRPILHGLVGGVRAQSLAGLPTKDKVPIVLHILGGHAMSTRMAASLPEIDHSISTWPQLASGVALGGAITADVARRILLGQHTESGRYYVDVERLVRDGEGLFVGGAPPPPAEDVAPEAKRPRSVPRRPPPSRVSDEAIRWIVAHAVLAPSAHNSQPWRFVWTRNGTLECRHDPAHDLPSLDFEHTATWLTFGCVAETIEMAALAIGLEPVLEAFPVAADPRLVLRYRFVPTEPREDPLAAWVPARCTNRRRDGRRPLPAGADDALAATARAAGCRLQLLTGASELDAVAELIGACDRVSAMNRAIHRDTMDGYRWTSEEVVRHGDGLDVATLELTAAERAGLSLLTEWSIMEALRSVGGGAALADLALKSVASASAVGLLTTRGVGPADFLRGGRAVQRVWLTATARGLAFQPMTGLPYLFARLERGGGVGLEDGQAEELRVLRAGYRELFDVASGCAELFLFRLGLAGEPTSMSLRRPLDAALTIE